MPRASVAFIVAVLTLSLSAGAAWARPVAHKIAKDPQQVTSYWTAKRMAEAVPADEANGPSAKPSKRGGNGGGHNGGGGPKPGASTEVPQPYPSAHGKVFLTDNGVDYVCSGTAIVASNKSTVWTAGHCVNEGPGSFFTNVMFVPAYRDGNAPYGHFAASALMTTSGWKDNGEYGVDVGAAVVGTNESSQTLSDTVAELSLSFNSTRDQSYKLYGYPAAKKFSGQRMRVCDTTWLLDDTSATPATMGVQCDMTGGSSGGAWVTSAGAVAAVTSYSYPNLRKVLFGPHLESEAQQLYSTAQSS